MGADDAEEYSAERSVTVATPRPIDHHGEVADERMPERCRWCGRRLPEPSGPGRPRRYCRQGCRQSAHLARKLAAAHGLADDDVIIDREALAALQGALYCFQAALEDVERDLAASSGPQDVTDALHWLRQNAEPVAAMWIEPRAT